MRDEETLGVGGGALPYIYSTIGSPYGLNEMSSDEVEDQWYEGMMVQWYCQ